MTSFRSALEKPQTDPTPIFEHYRGSYGTELLTAAVAHLNLFGTLSTQSLSLEKLGEKLQLQPRPLTVLLTALRAMGLVHRNEAGEMELTEAAREHLIPGAPFGISDYLGLAAESPGVLEMVTRLRTNRPKGEDKDGTAFIFREGQESAMEQANLARFFTLSLAGRARNTAPCLAEVLDLSQVETVLDVGGGTGIYSIALLQKNPHLKAAVLDRPEVLNVAREFAREYGVEDRLELISGDMFTDPFPQSELILYSNILHDWDIPECRQLIQKAADSLTPGGTLIIHDVFLNDALDGPLPVALYSAALFTLTEGRAYSEAEYTEWMEAAGLASQGRVDTIVHCGALAGRKA